MKHLLWIYGFGFMVTVFISSDRHISALCLIGGAMVVGMLEICEEITKVGKKK